MPILAPELSRVAAIARLNALAELDAAAVAALNDAVKRPRSFRIRRELITESRDISEPLLILSGWAARVRILQDGRRQVLNFLLPGDLVGLCYQPRPIASSTVIAITEVEVCVAPDQATSPSLARAYAMSRAMEEAYLLAQIVRLGQMNAHERIADLLLELLERLELAGMSAGGRYPMPLTQEVIADAVGLTSVHVNRTLQAMRREGTLNWKSREVSLPNEASLRRTTGRRAVRVSAT